MTTISEDIIVIIDLADLLAALRAQPDVETAMDGMHKVAKIIDDRARSVQRQVERQLKSARRSRGSATGSG